MKLETRRTIRGWLLSLPDKTPLVLGVGSAGVALLGLLIDTPSLFAVGFGGLVGVVYVYGQIRRDACQNCRAEVDVLDERYCSTCGALLDDLKAAPPLDERVAERFRPLGLEEIERSPEIDAIADGGSYEEGDA
jgi:hypothetical protein